VAGVNELLKFGCAANAADKIDSLARAGIGDAEDGIEHVLLQQGHIKLFDRVRGGGESRPEIQSVPFPVEIEAKLVFAARNPRTGCFDDEYSVELFEQTCRQQ